MDAMRNVGFPEAAAALSGSQDVLALEGRKDRGAKRRSPRVSARIPGLMVWREGETEGVEAIFADAINWFGCALHSRKFFRPGTHLRLEFADKTIECRVVESLKDHSTDLVTIGVAFDQIEALP
jgi:hypothetical protein